MASVIDAFPNSLMQQPSVIARRPDDNEGMLTFFLEHRLRSMPNGSVSVNSIDLADAPLLCK